MQTVILAGGRGERLRPLTDNIPKPLVPVLGRPYLEWQVEELVRQGVKRLLILTGYRGSMIESTLGHGTRWNIDIQYSHETEPLGTGGALLLAEKFLESQFLLLNGDSFLRADFAKMRENFERRGLPMLVATYDNRLDTQVANNLKIEEMCIVAYQKGAGAGYQAVDAGAYMMDRDVLERLKRQSTLNGVSTSRVQNLEGLWSELIQEKRVGAFPVVTRFYDIGTLARLREFELALRDGGWA